MSSHQWIVGSGEPVRALVHRYRLPPVVDESDEELGFVINDDVKVRMGASAEEEELKKMGSINYFMSGKRLC